MTLPAAEVEAARIALREHIADLTSISHHEIELDEGGTRNATTPPLLDQVAGEIAGNSQNAGPNTWGSKPPLWLDGSALLGTVAEHVAHFDGSTLTEQVRNWGRACASGTGATVLDAAEHAERWAEGCRNLLNPKPRVRFAGQACPKCGTERVWDRADVDNGENYARPALEIDMKLGACVCRACGEEWHPEMWGHLAQVLEQQRHETLAARGETGSLRAKDDAERGRNTYR
jgi:hypothetical protein